MTTARDLLVLQLQRSHTVTNLKLKSTCLSGRATSKDQAESVNPVIWKTDRRKIMDG